MTKRRHQRLAFVSGLEMSGYGILRSLARAKVPVIALTDREYDFGRYSKYCRRYDFYPAGHDEIRTCQLLFERGKTFSEKPVLFTAADWFALMLARHRTELADYYDFHWVSEETVATILDKERMTRFCEQRGVLVPRPPRTLPDEDVERSARDFPFPCVLKVLRSFDRDVLPKVDLMVIDTPTMLVQLYTRHPELGGTTMWQEIIQGADENVFECNVLVRASGEVGGVFCVRRLRQYPPHFGMMSFGRSEENEIVVSESLRLLRLLNYRGLANVEFKYRPEDNRYYFIEVNPRLPWSVFLFSEAGVNLSYLAYLDLTHEADAKAFCPKQKNGMYSLSLIHDLGWYVRTRREASETWWRWLSSLPKAKTYVWWDWRDPKPGFRAGLHLLRLVLRRLFSIFIPGSPQFAQREHEERAQ